MHYYENIPIIMGVFAFLTAIVGTIYSWLLIIQLKEKQKVLQGFTEGQKQAMIDIIQSLSNPEIRGLANIGQIKEAISKLEKSFPGEMVHLPENLLNDYIDILLLSKEESKWQKAWELLQKQKSPFLKSYISLSYLFWSIGRINDAIKVSEEGLKFAEMTGSQEALDLVRLKNNLAYYYADSGDPKYKTQAEIYISEVLNQDPENPLHIDTAGYIKIVFGNTKSEILQGVNLCEDARRKGSSFEIYIKHVNKAK